MMPDNATTSFKGKWQKLNDKRSSVLERARNCAKVTIPALMPPEGADENTTLHTPFQGLGARGINNLAAKLLLTLLPPNTPFFRLQVDDFTLQEMDAADQRADAEKALNKIERAVMGEVEAQAYRVPVFEAIRLLISTGNSLLYLPDDGGMKVYRLDQYVIKRDPMGNVLEILTKEQIHPIALPDEVREVIISELEESQREEPLDLFTYIRREEDAKDKWTVSQQCAGHDIPKSEGTYPLDKSPWIPLRWTSLAGEDYGRGLVEEYLGDILTLEALTKAITEGATIAARVIFLVNPNGTTRLKKLAEAANGSVIEGNAEDVSSLQVEKYNDFRIAFEKSQEIKQRLSQAFLLMESVQRDAERVTAEEIRAMAKELEDSLGGVYSVLSQEFQLPLVNRLMSQMTKKKRLPDFPKDTVKPSIITGLEALGRGNDLNKLMLFMQFLEPIGPEAMQYLNISDMITRGGTALGLDTNGLVKTQEQVQEEQQAAQEAQMAQQALPGMAQEMTKGMVSEGNGNN